MVAHICHPSTQKVKAEESENQEHTQLPIKFQASWGYMRPCLKTTKTRQAVVVHTFKSQPLGGRGRQISEFEASLVCSQDYTEKPCLQKVKQTNKN